MTKTVKEKADLLENCWDDLCDTYSTTHRDSIRQIGEYGSENDVGRLLELLEQREEYCWSILMALIDLGQTEGARVLLELIQGDLTTPVQKKHPLFMISQGTVESEAVELTWDEEAELRERASTLFQDAGPRIITAIYKALLTSTRSYENDISTVRALVEHLQTSIVFRVQQIREKMHSDPEAARELDEIKTQILDMVDFLHNPVDEQTWLAGKRQDIQESISQTIEILNGMLLSLCENPIFLWRSEGEEGLFEQ